MVIFNGAAIEGNGNTTADANDKGEEQKLSGPDGDTVIVNLKEFTHIFIITELCEGMDFKKFFETKPKADLSEDHIIPILYN